MILSVLRPWDVWGWTGFALPWSRKPHLGKV
jgi:hypothetical protein